MEPSIVVSLIATMFSILASTLSAMTLSRFSSVEQRLNFIETFLIERGEKHAP